MGQIVNCEYVCNVFNAVSGKNIQPVSGTAKQAANMEYVLKMLDMRNNGSASFGTGAYAAKQAADTAAIQALKQRIITSTSASELPVNAKIKLGTIYGNPIQWRIIDKNHPGYPDNSITLLSEKILSIIPFDAKEPLNSYSENRDFGNGRYIYSNIRQWMNKAESNWYIAQHSADAPPIAQNIEYNRNAYGHRAGFLSGFTGNERAAILTTQLIAYTGQGETDAFSDRIFLLSGSEAGFFPYNPTIDGAGFTSLNNASDRKAYPTNDAVNNSDSVESTDYNMIWWLRTSYREQQSGENPDANYNAYAVWDTGYSGGTAAFRSAVGFRPACNISSSLRLSGTADADGCYTPIF